MFMLAHMRCAGQPAAFLSKPRSSFFAHSTSLTSLFILSHQIKLFKKVRYYLTILNYTSPIYTPSRPMFIIVSFEASTQKIC